MSSSQTSPRVPLWSEVNNKTYKRTTHLVGAHGKIGLIGAVQVVAELGLEVRRGLGENKVVEREGGSKMRRGKIEEREMNKEKNGQQQNTSTRKTRPNDHLSQSNPTSQQNKQLTTRTIIHLLVLFTELVLQVLEPGGPLGQALAAAEEVVRQGLVAVHVDAEVHAHAVHLRQHCGGKK